MKQPIKMTAGDDLHLTMLMAPHSLNLAVGQFREQLLGYGRAAFEAGKAGLCLHQIQEHAPVTAIDALREAEAALEVAMARILKADPGHSIYVTSEAKALVAVRAALAATPAADAPLPLLVRDIARELGITCAEACLALKPLGNFSTNTAVTAEMMAKLRERFPERVPASEVAGARERMTAGRACYFMERFLKEEKLLGPNEQAALHYVIDMLEAAAAPVVLPEPAVSASVKQTSATSWNVEFNWPESAFKEAGEYKLYTEQQVRALLATGGQAQAPMQCVECNSCGSAFDVDSYMAGYTDGKGHCLNCPGVDHSAPQAQADAREAEYRKVERRIVMKPLHNDAFVKITWGADDEKPQITITGWDINSNGSTLPGCLHFVFHAVCNLLLDELERSKAGNRTAIAIAASKGKQQ